MPATELEQRVIEKLLAFLKSDAEIFDGLSTDSETAAVIGNLVGAARKLAAKMPSLPLDDLRDLLAAFLRRVIIQENLIQILISRKELRQLLEKGNKVVVDNLVGARKPVDTDDLISPASFCACSN